MKRKAIFIIREVDPQTTGPQILTHILDSDGVLVKEGDCVEFCLGLNTTIQAPVFESAGVLWISTPNHTPKSCRLDELTGFVGNFFEHSPT